MNSVKQSKVRRKGFLFNFAYDFVRITGVLPMLLWMRPKVHRPFGTKTPKGAVIFSANHVSMMDPITVHMAFYNRRMCSLATSNLFRNKFLSTFFGMMHCICVDKDNFSIASFREVTDYLNDGMGALIFPEGRINKEKDMLSFKMGMVLMAFKTKAKILPVYIVPREKWYERYRVVIGTLMDVAELLGPTPSMDDFQGVSEKIREQEIALKERYHALREKKGRA